METPRLLRLPEAAAALTLSEKTVRRLIQRDRLPGAVRLGNSWRVDGAKLSEFVAAGGHRAG